MKKQLITAALIALAATATATATANEPTGPAFALRLTAAPNYVTPGLGGNITAYAEDTSNPGMPMAVGQEVPEGIPVFIRARANFPVAAQTFFCPENGTDLVQVVWLEVLNRETPDPADDIGIVRYGPYTWAQTYWDYDPFGSGDMYLSITTGIVSLDHHWWWGGFEYWPQSSVEFTFEAVEVAPPIEE